MLLSQNSQLKAAQSQSECEVTKLREQLSRSEAELQVLHSMQPTHPPPLTIACSQRAHEQVEFLRKSVHRLEKGAADTKKEIAAEHTKVWIS